jgi:glycopeptide antibiotics resistance protein
MRVAVPFVEAEVAASWPPRTSVPPTIDRELGFARFAWVLLGYVVILAALATLTPFNFDVAHPHGLNWETTDTDVALNLAFLFPVGFLLRLARAERGWSYGLDGLCLGLAVSVLLELTQMFLPTRVSSPTDVATNGLGAWAGALTYMRVGPWLDRRLHKQLSLHLPLANIVYLLVPLSALNALTLQHVYDAAPQVPLAVFLAFIAAGWYKHRLEGSERPFANTYSLAIGAVFGIGSLPMCKAAPALWITSVLVMANLTRLLIAIGTRMPNSERRFVPWTIRRAFPWFVAYLIVLALRQANAPQIDGQQLAALGLLRDVASFTLFGYLASELDARSHASTLSVLAHAAGCGVCLASCFVVTRVGLPEMLAEDLGLVVLFTLATFAGAGIHRSQIRLVRSWGRSVPPPPART